MQDAHVWKVYLDNSGVCYVTHNSRLIEAFRVVKLTGKFEKTSKLTGDIKNEEFSIYRREQEYSYVDKMQIKDTYPKWTEENVMELEQRIPEMGLLYECDTAVPFFSRVPFEDIAKKVEEKGKLHWKKQLTEAQAKKCGEIGEKYSYMVSVYDGRRALSMGERIGVAPELSPRDRELEEILEPVAVT